MMSYVQRVESALADLKQGKMIILTDHPDREDEGDLIFPAELATADMINFMIKHCSGIICLSLAPAQVQKLNLSLMVNPQDNNSRCGTPFTVSIEAKNGVTTGVSAQDRATTILAAIHDAVTVDDIVRPGHVFPLQAREQGVLERAGHTEGAMDLARLAGFKPAGVLCEIMNADGTMARGEQLKKFAKTHQLKMLSIEDLIQYRLVHENLIEEISTELPISSKGTFKTTVVKEKLTGHEHIVLGKNIQLEQPVLVRIHSCCITGDLFGSLRCDCQQQLHYALDKIDREGGMLIYLNQEGRGIGLFNKIRAYALQDKGFDTVEANAKIGMPIDAREYHVAANILRNHGINRIRLMTNNPKKMSELQQYGVNEVIREAMPVFLNEHNQKYLQTKKNKLNHFIHQNVIST